MATRLCPWVIMMGGEITREEYENLLKEVRELRKAVEELTTTLKPLLYIVEKLPDLMVDPGLFKAAAPILSLPYALEKANLNVLGAAMVGGLECMSKSLESIALAEKTPQLSIMKILTDRETKEALGILLEILKRSMPCIRASLKQYTVP